MNNQDFSNKIQELVSRNQLDLAILELSKVASGSKILNDIVLQSSTLFNIKRQICNGTVTFEQASQQENKVKLALLELAQEIYLTNNNQFNIEINQVQKWDDLEEIVSIVNLLYETTNSILINNQRILSPIFTKNHNKQKLEEEMILLYQNQKNRGNFSRWNYYLKNKAEVFGSFDDFQTQKLIWDVINLIEKMQFILYSPIEQDSDYTKINEILDDVETWNSKPC